MENGDSGTRLALGLILGGGGALVLLVAGLLFVPLLVVGAMGGGAGGGGFYTGPTPHGTTTQNVLYWRTVVCREAATYKPWNQTTPQFVDTVDAIMTQESGGNPMALRRDSNGTVDAGLMQINSGNWAAYGLTADPFDPARNIAAGVQMLAGDLRRYGNVALALAAYNAGPGAVARWHGVPPYAAGYVQSVLALYARFVALSGNPTAGGGKGGKTEKVTKH